MELDMAVIRRTAASIVENGKPLIDACLDKIVPGTKMRKVLPYYSETIDAEMFPLLMFQQAAEDHVWEGMPVISNGHFRLNVYGYIHYDRDEFTDDLVAAFAAGVRSVFNRRHEPIPAGDGVHEIYFYETMPLSRITYGDIPLMTKGTLVAGFLANWRATVCYQQIDHSS